MLKGFLGFLLFIFFVIIFIVLVAWNFIIKTIRNFRKTFNDAADRQEQRYREETGRQRQQYSQRTQSAKNTRAAQDSERAHNTQGNEEQVRRTQTATGETIIDHRHQQRENKKIFDDGDGEYVEFTEE